VLVVFEGREEILSVFSPDFVPFSRSLRDLAVWQFDKAVPQLNGGALDFVYRSCTFFSFYAVGYRGKVLATGETLAPSVGLKLQSVS
jgi:hypothetical protein